MARRAIKKDHSDLAMPGAPDSKPEYLTKLANKWFDKYTDDGGLELGTAVPNSIYRASWAGSCMRQLGYNMRGDVAESDPVTVADAWRFNLGSLVHEDIQSVLTEAFPGYEVEKKVDMSDLFGFPASAHLDLWDPKTQTATEIKTINGFGFKMAASNFNGPPEGPRESAYIQGALSATALGAKRLKVLYLTMELLSPKLVLAVGVNGEIGRLGAEWTYHQQEFEAIALKEVERVKVVKDYIDAGELAPRKTLDIHHEAVIKDPIKGLAVRPNGEPGGRTWQCDYCGYRTRCIADGM